MSWMAEALCAGDWETFDSPDPIDVDQARRICVECPVRRHCADLAREVEPITGVWAALPWRPIETDGGGRLMRGAPVEVPA